MVEKQNAPGVQGVSSLPGRYFLTSVGQSPQMFLKYAGVMLIALTLQTWGSAQAAQPCPTKAELKGHIVAEFLLAQEQIALSCDALSAKRKRRGASYTALHQQIEKKFEKQFQSHRKEFEGYYKRNFGPQWQKKMAEKKQESQKKLKAKLKINRKYCSEYGIILQLIQASPYALLDAQLKESFKKEEKKITTCG